MGQAAFLKWKGWALEAAFVVSAFISLMLFSVLMANPVLQLSMHAHDMGLFALFGGVAVGFICGGIEVGLGFVALSSRFRRRVTVANVVAIGLMLGLFFVALKADWVKW